MERLTKREKFDLGNGEEMVLCNYDDSNCNDSCMYVKPCDWMKKAKQKLWDYENAEEQGLLLQLPCKVGDKVWAITSTANYSLGKYKEVQLKHPQEKKIQSITVAKNGLLYHVKDRTYAEQDFGKTVFLLKEKAEQALANMR